MLPIQSQYSSYLSRFSTTAGVSGTTTSAIAAKYAAAGQKPTTTESGATGATTASASVTISASTGTAAADSAADTQEQTLEQFKSDFFAWLDSVPIHPSQANAQRSMSIHDNVFQKMMDDPEYNQKFRDDIVESFSFAYPYNGTAFSYSSWDENGEYHGASGGSAHLGKYEAMSAGANWKKDGISVRKEAEAKENEKAAEEKKAKRKAELEEYLTELALQRRQIASQSQEKFANYMSGAYQTPTTKPITPTPMSMFEEFFL
ncbi:MAG: hypothetical protein LIQ30_04955 [Planctomycetes bacterium]|nr:hypothetical protein [Planctomycetota bacterium]MCD7897949.1 hypothetical protein [Planctomycetaceae bacterium]